MDTEIDPLCCFCWGSGREQLKERLPGHLSLHLGQKSLALGGILGPWQPISGLRSHHHRLTTD